MPIYSIIAFSALIVAGFSTLYAVKGNHRLYWISAIGIYIFSFLASFSIGLITVGLTFIPLAMAIGYSFGWIKSRVHCIAFLCAGVIMGFLLVFYVRDDLFYPLLPFFN